MQNSSGYNVLAKKAFKKGENVCYLDGVWVQSNIAQAELKKPGKESGIHSVLLNRYLDLTDVSSHENPANVMQEYFNREAVNLEATIYDVENSCSGIIPRVLLTATRDIQMGEVLSYEKGRNFYTPLGTFQSLSKKEQDECKAYYDIALMHLEPTVKTWTKVKSKTPGLAFPNTSK